jgi:accessory gene regulator B
MIVEWIAINAAKKIKEVDTEKTASLEVLIYGLKIIINTLSVILLTLTLGWMFGWLKEVIVVLVAFAILRSFSGGYHIKSSDLCILVSSGLMLLITATCELVNVPIYIYYTMNIISLIVMIMFSPSNKTKIKKEPKKFFAYKIISSLMIITLYVVHNELITITFFIQTITIIIGEKVKT